MKLANPQTRLLNSMLSTDMETPEYQRWKEHIIGNHPNEINLDSCQAFIDAIEKELIKELGQ